jgi:hypothetical protein
MAKLSASDFGRTGGRMRGFGNETLIIGDEKLSAFQKKLQRIEQSPEDRFREYVNAIAKSISDKGVGIMFSDDEIEMLLSPAKVESIKSAYLNPTAYLLGYYIAGDGGIDAKKMKDVLKVLEQLTDDKVKPADLVRYARFWMN